MERDALRWKKYDATITYVTRSFVFRARSRKILDYNTSIIMINDRACLSYSIRIEFCNGGNGTKRNVRRKSPTLLRDGVAAKFMTRPPRPSVRPSVRPLTVLSNPRPRRFRNNNDNVTQRVAANDHNITRIANELKRFERVEPGGGGGGGKGGGRNII